MRKALAKLTGAVAGAAVYLASASGAFAQYDYTYDSSDEGAGVLAFAMMCCPWMIALPLLGFRIWMLVHVIQNAPEDQKVLWILIVLLVPFGDWVYFFTKKKEWSKPKAEKK